MLAAIERKLTRIEARQAVGADMTAADSEREAREIGQLIRNYEKLTNLEAETESSKGRCGARSGRSPKGDDAERWREELTKRIERVRQQWATHSSPADTGT